MRIAALLMMLVGGVLAGTHAGADEGPLQAQNRFPLHLLFLTPRPTAPALPEAGEWRTAATVDYSAVYFQRSNRKWDVLIDLEMTTFDLALTWGLTSRFALSVDLTLVNMGGGFLDGFLENYHAALGVSNYGRQERSKNAFAYQAARAGNQWLQGEAGTWQFADSVVSSMFQLSSVDALPAMRHALITALKLPSGDVDRGTGSGRWDAGLYWTSAFTVAPWSFYLMPGVAWLSDPRTGPIPVAARDSYSVFAGAAYRHNERWRWLVQLNGYTSPLQSTGIDQLDDGAVELGVGFHYRLTPDWHVEFAFCEDLTRAAPDFTLHTGLLWHFDRRVPRSER